ncbi:alpha/beta fold hydrolase [Flammeovirga sp. SubArs3]|uniref:alpha/beta hydrolase family protein n=1 Tax=Flammeovirga sp. SubArs3 TaxID=2995316 RepID=UPI00248B2FA2|nr:alpha/beta fold hydrolase [Flammeovirga sp. SubArs3]
MKKIEFVLPSNYNQQRFLADARWINEGKLPTVILVHGFKGFKDWGAFNLIADTFAQQGYCCIKLNFHSDGTTLDMPYEVVDHTAFGNNNFSKELDDLGVLIDWLHHESCPLSCVDTNALYLLGHSRGGGVSLLKTAEDQRIKKVATLASIPRVDSFSEEVMQQWKSEGVIHVVNGRTQEELPLFYQAVEDFNANKGRLSIGENISKVVTPILLIHGDQDETVPVQSLDMLKAFQPNAETVVIEGASHTFGSKHPWAEENLPEHLQVAINKVLEHFGK